MTPASDTQDTPATSGRAARRFWIVFTALTVLIYVVFVIPAWRDAYEERSFQADQRAFTGELDGTALTVARSETLSLQVELYDALTAHGAGQWSAPAAGSFLYQAYEETWMTCPRGSASEVYSLAAASHMTDRDAAIEAIRPVAEAAGFQEPADQLPNAPGVTFYRPADNASISLRLGAATTVVVTTGCHTGTAFQEWPAGTEKVPAELRTTGRAPASGGSGSW